MTTLIGFDVSDDQISGASCGDGPSSSSTPRASRWRLTARQAKNPPVGSGEAFFVPFAAEMTAPWLVIAMTDGVWKYAGWHRIKEAASRLRGGRLIDALKAIARLPGSGEFQDDFTLIVVQDNE